MRFVITLLPLAMVAVARPSHSDGNPPVPNVAATSGPSEQEQAQYDRALRKQFALSTLVFEGSLAMESAKAMVNDLKDDVFQLLLPYWKHIENRLNANAPLSSASLYTRRYPDVLMVLPVTADNYDEGQRNQLNGYMKQFVEYNSIAVDHGYFKFVNEKRADKTVDLMKKYVENIHKVNLLPFLTENLGNLEYKFWTEVIALNDPFRARYYFFDIVAYQVIPKIVLRYVTKGELEQAIAFIEAMVNNAHLSAFFESIPETTRVNYFEQVTYAALYVGQGDIPKLLQLVQTKQGFDINRLYYCADDEDQPKYQKTIASAPGVIQPSTPEDEVDCSGYNVQFSRIIDFDMDKLRAFVENS